MICLPATKGTRKRACQRLFSNGKGEVGGNSYVISTSDGGDDPISCISISRMSTERCERDAHASKMRDLTIAKDLIMRTHVRFWDKMLPDQREHSHLYHGD